MQRTLILLLRRLRSDNEQGPEPTRATIRIPADQSGLTRGPCNKVSVPPGVIEKFLRMKLTRKEIAARLGIAVKTLRRIIKEEELAKRVADEDVLEAIREQLAVQPERGAVMLAGALRVKQPRWWVPRAQLRRVYSQCRTPEEMQARRRKVRFTSVYINPFANSVWHIDTHCKLAFAGLYVHAAVDGHSKLTVYSCVSPNNSSDWALGAFEIGCKILGCPRLSALTMERRTTRSESGSRMMGGRTCKDPAQVTFRLSVDGATCTLQAFFVRNCTACILPSLYTTALLLPGTRSALYGLCMDIPCSCC